MEIFNGQIKGFMGRGKKQAVDMGRNSSYHNYRRILWGLILVSTLSIGGCSLAKVKSSLMTGAATTAAVGVTTALTGGVIAPSVVGGVTAATASALSATGQTKGEPIAVTADTVVNKAPDNFWSLLGKLVGMGGWLLGLVILLPMVLGWILPGPLERRKKAKKR